MKIAGSEDNRWKLVGVHFEAARRMTTDDNTRENAQEPFP